MTDIDSKDAAVLHFSLGISPAVTRLFVVSCGRMYAAAATPDAEHDGYRMTQPNCRL
jgi:hypothetical protein